MSGTPIDARVSVVLCSYNGERYLAEQLQSILAQSLLPGEIVLSDDGSTDRTPQIVADFAERSPVPVVVRSSAQALGVTQHFAAAIQASSGEFVVLADQDDVWREDRLSRAVRAFDVRPELQLVASDARLVGADGAPLGTRLFASLSIGAEERSGIDDGRAFQVLLRRNLVTGATVMVRREVIDAALPFPTPWVHDEWLAIIAAARGPVEMLDEPLIDYRQHGANQIGVAEPTLGYKVRRLLAPGRQRNADIAARVAGLADALARLGDAAPFADLPAVAAKLDFERFRAELPDHRLQRVVPVLRRVPRGEYQRYASQGILDVARDLLQPA